MKPDRRDELFRYYAHYWIVELKLHDKYKFNLKKDNRIACYAYVETTDNQYVYNFKYNTKKLTTRWKIISVVLHELGHILHDFRTGNSADHEYTAELFSLKKSKEYYPKLYPFMVNWTKKALKKKTLPKEHREGYTKALKELGEL